MWSKDRKGFRNGEPKGLSICSCLRPYEGSAKCVERIFRLHEKIKCVREHWDETVEGVWEKHRDKTGYGLPSETNVSEGRQ
jgi:hypothetical protein